MLIEFKTTRRYKSFKDGFTLSMEARKDVKGLDFSVFKSKHGEILPTAVIYGREGKDQILMAIEDIRSMLLIKNVINYDTGFFIRFIINGKLISYEVERFSRNEEILYVDKQLMFESDRSMNAPTYLHTNFAEKHPDIYSSIFEWAGMMLKIRRDPFALTKPYEEIFSILSCIFKTGGTLVLDTLEFKTSIDRLVAIINAFHNDELNKKNAQLIFLSENPLIMHPRLFRCDEIHFVDEDIEGDSKLYSLADFKLARSKGKKNQDWCQNYLNGAYGAIGMDESDKFLERLESYLAKED